MGKVTGPRKGSMAFWPRRRSKKPYARVRFWPESAETKLMCFAGYKAGMTHIIVTDNRPHSLTKGEDLRIPVTVIECPNIKILGLNFYKKTPYGLTISTCVLSQNLDKELKRKISVPKKTSKNFDDIKEFDDVRAIIYTQPKKTGIGKKKPDIFEVGIGGEKDKKVEYIKNLIGKEISINDVFTEGQQVDIRSITKGKGTQGPVKRFGISLKAHKSEKGQRRPGSLGPWKGQQHIMYRVAQSGKTGYYVRNELNKWIVKISDKIEEINPNGGFVKYGLVKNNYVLLKGSVPGSINRLIKMTYPSRPNRRIIKEAPTVQYVSIESKQRR